MKLSEAYEVYEIDKRILGYSEYTFKAYRIQNNLLIKHFGNADVETITYSQLKQYLGKDAQRLKPSSLGHRVRFLRSLFRYLHEEGLIPNNPASKLREPKNEQRIPKYVKQEDLECLREYCKIPLEHCLLELMYSSGMRVGEVFSVDIAHIDWDRRSIVVFGKGSKEREVYFSVKCKYWLKKYIDSRSDENPALFITQRKQSGEYKRLSIHQMRWTLKQIAKRSSINVNIYPHRMRHSLAQSLLNNDCPIEMIQSILGHSKIETTKLYLYLHGDKRREVYNRYFLG